MKIYEYILRIKDQATDKISRFNRAVESSRDRLGRYDKRMQEATSSTNMFGGALSTLTRWLSIGALGALLTTTGVKASKLARDFEQTSISFEVMIGNARQGRQMLSDIEQMAIATPFKSSDLQSSGKLLLGYGVNAKKILPTLRMLGDISGGNAEKLHLLSLAYAQTQAAGRLMGQDLLQMVNAGFNPLQTISEKTGISIGKLKKQMEEGAISAKIIEAAFRSATQEGGRFHDMMEKQSKTFEGRLNALDEKWEIWLRGIGSKINTILAPYLDKAIEIIDRMIDPQGALQSATDKQADSFHKLYTSIMPAISRYEQLLAVQKRSEQQEKELLSLRQKIGNEIPTAAEISPTSGHILGIDPSRAKNFINQQDDLFQSSNKIAIETAKDQANRLRRQVADMQKEFKLIQDDGVGGVSMKGLEDLRWKYLMDPKSQKANWEGIRDFFTEEDINNFDTKLKQALDEGNHDNILSLYLEQMNVLNEKAAQLDARMAKLRKDSVGVYLPDEEGPKDDWKKMGEEIMQGKSTDGTDKITGGGRQPINVTVNIDTLNGIGNVETVVGQMEINKLMKLMEEMATEKVIEVANSANNAAQQ